MKRLGLVGYFNFGNYGDQLFLKVFDELFPDFELKVMHSLSRAPYFTGNLSKKVGGMDGILIGGGDLVIPWALSDLYWRGEYLEKPVFIVGVGVPTWGGKDDGVIKKMSDFFQHSNIKYIHCRDAKSADWIRKTLKPKIEVHHSADIACSLDYTQPHNGNHSQRIFGLITRTQSNKDYSNIEALCHRAIEFGYKVNHIILGTDNIRKSDLSVLEHFDFPYQTIIERDSIDELTNEIAKCSVVCSMKFHGCVAAYMIGIPIISLSKADKFVSFFQDIQKEIFLSVANDKTLPSRLINPMYRISQSQVQELRANVKLSLLKFRHDLIEELT